MRWRKAGHEPPLLRVDVEGRQVNLLVSEDEHPVIVDFGTAFVHKDGFHPLNNWLFRTAKRMDLNAWVKHKYHGFYSHASEEDRALLDYSWPELLARRLSGRPMDRLKQKKGL